MSELFHSGSGDWNKPGNQLSSSEVAKEPTKEEVLHGDNTNMFGASATKPSAASGGHGDVDLREETSPKSGEPAVAKKANPFV